MFFPPITLVFALLLLWAPLWVLRAKAARLTGFEQRNWPGGRNAALAFADTLRASVGSWLLWQSVPELPRVVYPVGAQEPLVFGAVLMIGLVVQTLVWRDEDFVFAPVTYALGVVCFVAHPVVLLIILPLAVGSAFAMRAWAAGLLGGGIGLIFVGLLVEQQDWRLAVLTGLSLCATVLLSLLVGRHFGWARR
jgi:hypothetical protein